MQAQSNELFKARFPHDLPVTGAWQPGDPLGYRVLVNIAERERPFALEGGGILREVRVAYETWGELNEDASNAVLVCHALTGDSHAAGDSTPSHPLGGWWSEMIGGGLAIDTDRYFVVCSNVLGGCQGSTGPADVPPGNRTDHQKPPDASADSSSEAPASSSSDVLANPSSDALVDSSSGVPVDQSSEVPASTSPRRYGARFPVVTIRDMVRVQARLADHLGIRRWLAVIGGSMGGMQVLEWAAMYPRRVRSVLPLATCSAASPLQIAWSAVGRLAISGDPHWNGGDYYDSPCGPWRGLATARELAQVTYRSGRLFDSRFGREILDQANLYDLWGRFQIESYLDHHGQKLVRRFDANSYLILNKAMDLHDIGRARGGVSAVLQGIGVPVLTASISSDALYPPYQQHEIHTEINAAGGDCQHVMIKSDAGHDGFLLEHDQLHEPVNSFLADVMRSV